MDTDTPKISRRLILFFCSLVISAAAYAQTCKPTGTPSTCPTIPGVTCSFAATIEKGCNCYDNVDNDGDGKIDSDDIDCAYYLTTYVGAGSTCSLPPPTSGSGIFTGVADVASAQQNTADTPAKISVGDIDGDGIPDVCVTSKFNRTIQVVCTQNNAKGDTPGDIMADWKTQFGGFTGINIDGAWALEHETAIANTTGDKKCEMYTIASKRGGGNSGANDPPTEFALLAFSYVRPGTAKGNITPMWGVSLGTARPGTIGLADFNGDGLAEVYVRNQIYAAENGTKLADGGGDWKTAINTGSVAVDINLDGTLELVCGNFIYTVPSLTGRTLQTLTVLKDMNTDFPATKFYPKGYNDVNEYGITQASMTSVADFDVDGYPDVFISGAVNCSGNEASPCGSNPTTVFYWNVHNNTLKTYTPPDGTYALGWVWGTGRVNLYDAYPNHEGLEALFMAGQKLFCLDNSTFTTGNPLWVRNTPNDALSGILSVTVYDFDNDGDPEVVYRDTQQLVVVSGKTGQGPGGTNNRWATTCQSHTMTEGPIIADVNGDGATDICITCYTNTGAFDISKSTPQQQSLGQVHLYYTNSSTWLPTRKVWNQHPYFVVNINDDMTLPKTQIDQSLIFGNGTCPNGVNGPQRPLNLFMDQVPHLSASGCPEFPAPDLVFYGDTPKAGCSGVTPLPAGCDSNGDGSYLPTVDITPPICGNLDIKAKFNIQNNGDLAISDNVPVSFFWGDPTTALTGTITSTTGSKTVTGTGTSFLTDLAVGMTLVNYATGATIGVVASIASNTSLTLVANGAVAVTGGTYLAAARLYNTSFTITNLNIGSTFTSPQYSFNGPGTTFKLYTVIYNNGNTLPITLTGSSAKECTISNNIYSTTISPTPFTVTVEKVQDNLNCPPYNPPNSGQLRTRIYIGGVEVTDYSPYSFQWYTGSTTASPIAGATLYNLSNLDQGTYGVVVTNTQKGCSNAIVTGTIARSNPVFPAFTITKVSDQTLCTPANGELIVAPADGSTGYTYTWQDIALNPIGVSGADAKNLLAGNYVVQIQKGTCICKDPITGGPCASSTVAGPQYPDAQASTLADVVDCLNPNSGSTTANAFIGGVQQPAANYTFNWYFYNNVTSTRGSILPAPNNNLQTTTGLAAGWYQAVITDNTTKCTATTSPTTEVKTSTVTPSATITELAPQTSCDPNQPNGKLTAVGTATGYTSPTDFTFEWFRGDNTLAANKIPIAGGPETVSGSKGEQLNNAKGGGVVYTVRVTTPKNCSATNKLTLNDNPVQPVLVLAQSPNSICDATKTSPSIAYNGSITATVTFNGVGVTLPDPNYTFNWYDGTTTTTAHTPATSGGPTLSGLKDGDYAATVTRTDLHCTSIAQTKTVLKTTVQPILAPTSTGSNNCDPALTPDGTVTVGVTNPQVPAHNYTYQWYEGNSTVAPSVALGVANNGTSATAIKVGGPFTPNKIYTVYVRDISNGCDNTTSQTVSDVSVIPVLTTSTAPNSICSPATNFNGSMTATVTNIPAGYTVSDYSFTWYDGNTSATLHNPQPSPVSTVTLPKLDVGTYSVIAKNTKTGCPSSLYTNNVIPAKIFPALQPASTGSNNCDPLLTPDGTVSYSVTNTGASPGPFTQQWYVGGGADPIVSGYPTVPAAPNNGTSVTAIKLGGPNIPAGSAPRVYTVLVTNTATGCTNYTTASVPDNSVVPVVTTATTGNGVCDLTLGFQGTMTATVTNIPALYTISDYKFDWYNGNTTASSYSLAGPNPLTGLDSKTFSVIATNTKTGCVSALATNTVGNTKVYPTLAPSATGSNNCVVGGGVTNDGTASVVASGTVGGYSYQWYDGAGDPRLGGGPTIMAGKTTATLTGVGGPVGAPHSYTVLVKDVGTGCDAYATPVVPDNSVKPILSTSTLPNDICDVAKGYAGSMTATITNIPAGYVLADYDFTFKTGGGTTLQGPGTTNVLSSLDVGSYTAEATNRKTGCASLVYPNAVGDSKVYPVVAVTSTGSHNCTNAVTPDGTASATVTPIGADTFLYSWTAVAPATAINNPVNNANTANAIKLGGPTNAPNSYLITVTDFRTGCVGTNTAQVSDLSQKPTFTLTPTDNTVCTNTLGILKNGHVDVSAVVHPQLGTSSITYKYFSVDATGTTITGTLATHANLAQPPTTDGLTNLAAAYYAATVNVDALGCTSDPVIVQIKDAPVLPAFSVTPTPSTNCPTGADNGSISATVSNAGGNTFSFDWHKGNLVTDPAVVSVDASPTTSISNQQGGKNYTVQATNLQSGCKNSFTQTLADNSVPPTFTLTPTVNDKCIAPMDGKVVVTGLTDVNAIGGDTYTVSFTSTVSPPQTGASMSYLNQPKSFATATVKNDRLGCTSAAVVEEIKEILTYPTITTAVVNSTNCAGGNPNGTATVTAVVPADTYEYRWYAGATVGAAGTEINGAAPGGIAGISGKQGAADFTVEVNLTSTGCRGSKTITIQDVSQLPLITPLDVTPNQNCTAPYNGTAFVNAGTPFTYRGTTITFPYTGFTLTWSGGTVGPVDKITALQAGNYTLQVKAGAGNTVTNNNDNCISNLATAVIVDQLTPPVVSSTVLHKQTSCGATNGQMKADETSGSGSYNFDWYKGVGPVGGTIATAASTTTSSTAANLASSNYTVVVTNTSTRCSTTQTTFLPPNIVYPTLTLTQTQPVDNCGAPNGIITATTTVTSTADGDFTFYWLKETGNNFTSDPTDLETDPATTSSTLNASLVKGNLFPAYYTGLVRDEITHCESQAVNIHVDDNTAKATISINSITKATFCNAGNDGAMDINVAGGVPGYTFAWHKDGPTNAGPYNFFAGSLVTPTFADGVGFATTEDISSVAAGLFTVVVKDSKGCGTVYSNSVPFQNAPHIGKVAVNSTQCDVLAGDGSIMTEFVGPSDYQVKIYKGTDVASAIVTVPVATSADFGNDGIDNDGDGLTDCAADSDCDSGANPRCTNGVDDDGDGLIDSNDPDCDAGNVATCTNGIDDDGDGLIDSADPDCDTSGGLKGVKFTKTALNPGGYIIEIKDLTINCPIYQSATVSVDALKPVVDLSILTPNTSCTPSAAADGSVQITVDKDPLDMTVLAPVYRITGITGTALPTDAPVTDPVNAGIYPYPVVKATPKTLFSTAVNGDPFTGGFGPDTYTITVKETNSGCTVDKVIAIPDQPKVPSLIDFNIVNDSFCAPNSNGSITVTTVSPVAIADYDYHWYTDVTLTTQIYTGVGVAGATLNKAAYPAWVNPTAGLGIGTRTYYVQGIRNATSSPIGVGCPTPAVQVVVQDTHVTPQMSLTSLPNTSCDPTVGEGSISISTTTAGGGAVGTANYDYILDPAGLNVTAANKPGTPATAWFTLLKDNTYLVRATNLVSGCKTESSNTVSSSKYSLAITAFTSQDKLMCNPDGQINVTQITTDRTLTSQANVLYAPAAAPTLANNFDFRWFRTTAPTGFADVSNLKDGTATTIAGEQLTDGAGAGQYPTMGSGLFYVIGKHKTGAGDLIGQGCSTPPIQVNINDKHVNPTVTLAPFSDTSCAGAAAFEGSIDVTVTDASVTVPPSTPYNYNYSWTSSGTTTPGPTAASSGALATFANLQDGSYQMTALNNMTGCSTVANATIIKNVTPVFVNNYVVNPQLICNNNGDIQITGITYKDRFGNPQPAPVPDFSFSWTRTGVGAVGNASALLNIGSYPGISAGTYSVTATRTTNSPGNGCTSAPINIQIEDKHINPVPSISTLSNTSCNSTAPGEGEIKINVTDATAAPYAGGTYSYVWNTLPATQVIANTPVNDGDGSAADGDGDNPKLLLDGSYQLAITNNTTGCKTVGNATILKNAVPVFVQTVNTTDQIACFAIGDGSLTVAKVSVNDRAGTSTDFVTAPGAGQGNISDFDFGWTRNPIVHTQTTTGAGGNVLNSGTYNAAALPGGFGTPIGAATYTVTATRTTGSPGNGCKSAPFTATIADKRIYPVVTLTPFSNTSCNTAFEGEIKVKVTDATTYTPVPAGGFKFDYTWTTSPNPIAASVGNNGNELNDGAGPDKDYVTGQQDGGYTVNVTNPTTQCAVNSSTTITKNATPVFVQTVDIVDQILCTPDGSLTVSKVTLNDRTGTTTTFTPGGASNLLTDFQFEWQRVGDANGYTEITNGAVPPAGSVLNSTTYVVGAPGSGFAQTFGAATYTVVARRKAGSPGANCASSPYSVVLQDKSIKPVVTLTPFANTSCSVSFEGEITVGVTDATANNVAHTFITPYSYSYNWTTSATPGVINGAIAGTHNGNNSGTDGDGDNPKTLSDGAYTLAVTNTQTGCVSSGSTTIFKNSTPVFTQLVTPTDQVLCSADGKLEIKEVQLIDRTGTVKSNLKPAPNNLTLADFNFDWQNASGTVIKTTQGVNGAVSGGTILDNNPITGYATIGAGTYYAVTKRVSGAPGLGCQSAPYKVDILDKRVFPVASLTPLSNTSCDPAFFEGEIKVKVTDASVNLPAPYVAGTPFSYNYNWTTVVTAIVPNPSINNDGDGFGGGENDGVGIDNDNDHPKALKEGTYVVSVTNAQTQCQSSGTTTIFKNGTPVFTQLVVPTAQVICKPDGKLEVKEVKIIDRNGVVQSNLNLPPDFALSDFVFTYDRVIGGVTTNVLTNAASPILNNVNYSNPPLPPGIGFGTYFVTTTRKTGFPGKDCSSAPYRIDIDDQRLFPKVAFTSIANSSCNSAKANGSVVANASEQSGAATDPYTFSWTVNGGALPAPAIQTDASPKSTITNAVDGAYIVTATNTTTGCPFNASFNLLLDQTRSTPNIIDVATVDPVNCNPTAGAEVTKITLGSTFNSSLQPPQIPPDNTVTGVALGGPRFVYTWYEGSISNPPLAPTLPCIGPLPNSCGVATTGLLTGDHFVKVLDTQTDCQSGPKQFVIKPDNIIYPVASITQTVKQISCIATTGTAKLEGSAIEADGTTGNYTFTWYPSLNLTGTPYTAPTAPSTTTNPNVLQNLVVGNYSMQVLNTATNCTASAIFIVPDESPLFMPAISTGAAPQTFCVGTDGDANVRIILDPAYPLLPYDNTSFRTDLYKGGKPVLTNPPDVASNIPFTVTGAFGVLTYDVPSLLAGTYTFKVTDLNTGCVTSDSTVIKLQQTKPVITIVQDNPMTNCDPVIANGQLSATANGGKVQGYTFDWYAGTSVTGSILQTDNKLIGQRSGNFTVRTTENLTGCFDDKTGKIDDATVTPPTPIAKTLHEQTSCISPNGVVDATVGGITQGYSFQWYNGSYKDKASLPSIVNFKFANYYGRDVGDYTVTATDDVTHCVSQPATTPVVDKRVQPDFKIDGTPSYCIDVGRPTGNGSFTLTSKVDVAFQEILWTLRGTGAFVGFGPYVAELFPGDYHVKVTTVEGCFADKDVKIETEIKPYNLVSSNSDGKNDAFLIDCIGNFPGNNVKIFNRNGTLVYEADGYDNLTVFFRGVGEKGVYLSDKELPEGTYFYIIDKRNGEKPKSGFLELIR